ncbi:hypothetical protein JHK85_012581 [Glycine max]|nr:hypothetical protein JHK85_012581 [Glycine max]
MAQGAVKGSRLRFRDCNHIVEIVFVEIVLSIEAFVVLTFAHFRRSKKSRKGKNPGKGTPRACFSFCLSSCLSQTGLRFRDCNHIFEFAFVEFVSALPSKTTGERNYVKEELCLHFLCYISLLHFLSTSLMNLLNIQVSGTPNPSAISSNISHASSLTASVSVISVKGTQLQLGLVQRSYVGCIKRNCFYDMSRLDLLHIVSVCANCGSGCETVEHLFR